MLEKVEVSGFKGFKDKFIFSLTKSNYYNFNSNALKNDVVNKSIVYGRNGVGKSNISLAIFDIITNITDKDVKRYYYGNYINVEKETASFLFQFKFNDGTVIYEYEKSDFKKLISEKLTINENVVMAYDRRNGDTAQFNIKGTENLRTDIGDSPVSIISYVKNNAILEDSIEKSLFLEFCSFVDRMLYFRSLDDKRFIGIEQESSSISDDILKRGNLNDFESFLNESGVKCKLAEGTNANGDTDIYFLFDNDKKIPFFSIASTGTTSLALFYFWYQRMKDNKAISFICIDEFDAFYHHELSIAVVKKLMEINAQVILTTHNTSVMNNNLLRPDCYFVMNERTIKSLSNLSEKELRQAHNLEKLYRGGAFVNE